MWLQLTIMVATLAAGLALHLGHQTIDQHYMTDISNFAEDAEGPGGRKIVNITDRVYKSALRFLRCSSLPDNPYGIALLDPLEFSWNKLAHRQTIRLDGWINGIASELSHININYVNVVLAQTNARLEGHAPRLSISGSYNVSGNMAATVPIFGSGPYSIELTNVTIVVKALLRQNSTGGVTVTNFTVNFSPESIQVSLGELMGGGPLGDIIQDFLQDSAQQVLLRSFPMIRQNLEDIVIKAANNRLTTLKELVRFFVSFGNITAITC